MGTLDTTIAGARIEQSRAHAGGALRAVAAPRLRWTLLLTSVLAILPYTNSLRNDFTFDDPFLIRDNPMIVTDPPRQLWTAVYYPGGLYRPLTMLTYAANHWIDPDPFGFHVVNLVLHTAVSLLVAVLAHVLLASSVAAAITGVLFAVHPIHTEAVSSIVGRAELLSALFVLTALLSFAHAQRAHGWRRRGWLIAALVAFAAGLLSKESAFTAIGLVITVAWWLQPRRSVAQWLTVALPFVAVGVGYLGVRLMIVGSLALPVPPPLIDNPLAHVTTFERLGTAVVVLFEYLSQLFLPVHLSADYSFNQIPVVTSISDPRLVLALSTWFLVLALCAAAARRAPAVALAALFTLVPLALTANVLFPIGTIKAERLLYLSSVGWALGVGWAAAALWPERHRVTATFLVVIVIAFSGRTLARNHDWRNDLTLFDAALQTAPNSAKVHHNLAVAYDKRGATDAAKHHLLIALEIHPDCADAALTMGSVSEKTGAIPAALYWYARAIRSNWSLTRAHQNIGSLRYQLQEFGAAESAFRSGLAIEPNNAHLGLGLGLALLAQDQRDEAQLLLAGIDPWELDNPTMRDVLVQARSSKASVAP